MNSTNKRLDGAYRPVLPESKILAPCANGNIFTAPYDGVWIGLYYANFEVSYCLFNGIYIAYAFASSDGYGQNKSSISIPMLKGDTIAFNNIWIAKNSEFYRYR